MKARTRNTENNFILNIKLAEGETEKDTNLGLFNKNNPEGNYVLDLAKMYDYFVLQ